MEVKTIRCAYSLHSSTVRHPYTHTWCGFNGYIDKIWKRLFTMECRQKCTRKPYKPYKTINLIEWARSIHPQAIHDFSIIMCVFFYSFSWVLVLFASSSNDVIIHGYLYVSLCARSNGVFFLSYSSLFDSGLLLSFRMTINNVPCKKKYRCRFKCGLQFFSINALRSCYGLVPNHHCIHIIVV